MSHADATSSRSLKSQATGPEHRRISTRSRQGSQCALQRPGDSRESEELRQLRFLQAASKAACTDKPKVELDKSARFGESLQLGTVMWKCQGECAGHDRPSPCGALEPVAAVGSTEGSRKAVPDQFAATTDEMGGRLIKHAGPTDYCWQRAI